VLKNDYETIGEFDWFVVQPRILKDSAYWDFLMVDTNKMLGDSTVWARCILKCNASTTLPSSMLSIILVMKYT
jgi:hypothetical protein